MAAMTFRRSMRLISSVGLEIIYTVVSIMQKMSQNHYKISYARLNIKLDLIDVVL
jgi:hypothetical protein